MNDELRAKFFDYFCRTKDFEAFMKSDFMQPKVDGTEEGANASPDSK
ncbi:hypothetical protein [uncultured Exiguobacterium sp.]|nr:hypothetical protein [uncultured Exiguobacterium sp.]